MSVENAKRRVASEMDLLANKDDPLARDIIAVMRELGRLTDENRRLREALQAMVDHEVEYMTINNLGDPEKQHNVSKTAPAPPPATRLHPPAREAERPLSELRRSTGKRNT